METASSAVSDTNTPEPVATSEPKLSDIKERELFECLRSGENQCYEMLVRWLGPQVLATAKRYLRSDADAADCFQDTFLAVFQNIDKFEQRSSIGTWVRGITINQCLMRIRKQGRRQEESIEHLLPVFDENGNRVPTDDPVRSSAVGESIDRSRMKQTVREKINSLPDNHRVVLLLRDIDGYSTKETAAILGIQVNAVKTRLHRARSALKSLLEPVLENL